MDTLILISGLLINAKVNFSCFKPRCLWSFDTATLGLTQPPLLASFHLRPCVITPHWPSSHRKAWSYLGTSEFALFTVSQSSSQDWLLYIQYTSTCSTVTSAVGSTCSQYYLDLDVFRKCSLYLLLWCHPFLYLRNPRQGMYMYLKHH